MKEFVKLTLFDDGKPVYIDTESIVAIYASQKHDVRAHTYRDMTCVYVGSVIYEVKEGVDTVMDMVIKAEQEGFLSVVEF